MKSPLFGYLTGLPVDDDLASLLHVHAPQGSADELINSRHLLLRGSRAHVAVARAPDADVVVLLAGAPLWQGTRRPLQVIAEALLAAYRLSGTSCLKGLSNEFCAAVIDVKQRQAYLQIDKIGRMRLAYALLPDGSLCFSSDARLVVSVVHGDVQLNPQSIYNYAFFHAVPSPQTIFADVHKLPPAGGLSWSPGNIKTEIYWRPEFSKQTSATDTALQQEFLECLEAGVRDAAAGASTASFLSGGIDSSTVTGLLAKTRGPGVPAYTIGFEQAGYDETSFATTAAQHFGADLRVLYITTHDVQNCIPELAALYDEPFGNSSAVPALMCARAAHRDGITQMLAGDGGDELFAGNTRYAKQRVFEIYGRIPALMRSLLEATLLNSSSMVTKTPLRKVASYIRQARIPLPDRLESYNFLLRENIANMFEPEFLRKIDAAHPFSLLREQYQQVPEAATLDRMLYLDWKFTLADNDLRKVISTCNYAGIDVDFPWLDDRLVEFSTRLPAELKMHGTQLRFFVKNALADFLPQATITKSKHGFGLPFGEWLKTSPDLQAQIYDLLSALGKRGIFQSKFLTHLISEHRENHAAYYGTMVWVLALLEAWLQSNEQKITQMRSVN